MARDLIWQESEYRRATAERSRRERWAAPGTAKVTHPAHGSVVVPHRSNYAALLNARRPAERGGGMGVQLAGDPERHGNAGHPWGASGANAYII